MSELPIPFTRPHLTGRELAYLQKLIGSGDLSANGPYSRACEALLREATGSIEALLTTSCSSALEMAACLLDLAPGDEVIVPSFTFVTTVSSFARFGAKPVFVDIRADTCNIDETLVEAAVSERTRAIVVMHYAGTVAEMDALQVIAERHGLVLIEDAAQALYSGYNGKPAGSIGTFGTISFHETKNFISGEGGALCVNDPDLVDRSHIIRDKGTNRRAFFQGNVDKYTWVDMGASYVVSEVLAAILQAQLETAQEITAKRREHYAAYREGLSNLESAGTITLPVIPAGCEPNGHLFHFLLSQPELRPQLLSHLKERGIGATFHYIPLHNSPQGRKLGGDAFDLPVTDRVSASLVRLPLYPDLTTSQRDHVIEAVNGFFLDK